MGFRIKESFQVLDLNPVVEIGQRLTESEQTALDIKGVRAIFPYIRAITGEKMTRNKTVYSTACLKGLHEVEGMEVGYKSFVKPYGSPILTEHRAQDEYFPADRPMGRVVWAGYKPLPVEEGLGKNIHKGNGFLGVVAGITDPEGIRSVLARELQTVSIGSTAHSIIDSISKKDLVKLWKKGESTPHYRGQEYDGQLCYWIINGFTNEELSWVNVPSDTDAGMIATDLGEAQVRMLLSEKVLNKEEFKFYDLVSKEEVILSDITEFAMDTSFGMVDSYSTGKEFFIIDTERFLTESNNEEDMTEDTEIIDQALIWKTELKAKLEGTGHALLEKELNDWTLEDIVEATTFTKEAPAAEEDTPSDVKSLDDILTEVLTEVENENE